MGDRLYQVNRTGELVCIDVKNGATLWKKKLGTEQLHALIGYADGKLYVPVMYDGFYIIKPTDAGPEISSHTKLRAMGRGVRAVTWSTLAYVCLMVILTYAFFVSLFKANPEVAQTMNDQWAMLWTMSALSPVEKPFLMALFVLSIACSVPLGVAGLVLVGSFRRKQAMRERPGAPAGITTQGSVPEA